jgi:hypothetical protein
VEVSETRQSTRNWLGIAGLVVGILAFVSDMNGDLSVFRGIYGLLTGWAFIGVAFLLWDRLADNRMPLLIALVGFTYFIGDFFGTHVPVIVGLSFWFGDLFRAVLAQTGLSHPIGRLRSRVALALVGIGYLFILIVGLIRAMANNPHEYFTCDCPRNTIGFIHSLSFFDTIDTTYGIIGSIIEIAVIVLLLRQYASARREGRSAGLPSLATAVAFVMMLGMDLLTKFVDFSPATRDWLYLPVHIALAAAALSFLLAFGAKRIAVARAPAEAP